MIAREIYDARAHLQAMFPTLDIVLTRSGQKENHYVVGMRPMGNVDAYIWEWDPVHGFPSNELWMKLSLIA